jgi:hypothetical protein
VTRVEFRFLRWVVWAPNGDSVSVALVHWDGTTLRTAQAPRRLSICHPAQRDVARATVGALLRRAKSAPRDNRGAEGLAELFSVREGAGGALNWGPILRDETRDAEKHFAAMAGGMRGEGLEKR